MPGSTTEPESNDLAVESGAKALAATLRKGNEFLQKGNAAFLDQLEASVAFLEARRDAMPVSLAPTRNPVRSP